VGLACLTVALGLGSRKLAAYLPRFVAEYAGDALYATLVFFLVAFVVPAAPRVRIAAAAFAFSCLVEVSQLSDAHVLVLARSTVLGRLVLGTTFVWSDIPLYGLGALLGAAVDVWLFKGGTPASSARRPPPRSG
jgi:hypothetical protein